MRLKQIRDDYACATFASGTLKRGRIGRRVMTIISFFVMAAVIFALYAYKRQHLPSPDIVWVEHKDVLPFFDVFSWLNSTLKIHLEYPNPYTQSVIRASNSAGTQVWTIRAYSSRWNHGWRPSSPDIAFEFEDKLLLGDFMNGSSAIALSNAMILNPLNGDISEYRQSETWPAYPMMAGGPNESPGPMIAIRQEQSGYIYNNFDPKRLCFEKLFCRPAYYGKVLARADRVFEVGGALITESYLTYDAVGETYLGTMWDIYDIRSGRKIAVLSDGLHTPPVPAIVAPFAGFFAKHNATKEAAFGNLDVLRPPIGPSDALFYVSSYGQYVVNGMTINEDNTYLFEMDLRGEKARKVSWPRELNNGKDGIFIRGHIWNAQDECVYLCVCTNNAGQEDSYLVRIDKDNKLSVVAKGLGSVNHLVIANDGSIWCTSKNQVVRIDPGTKGIRNVCSMKGSTTWIYAASKRH